MQHNKRMQTDQNVRYALILTADAERYAIPLERIMILRFIAIIIFFTPQLAIGGETSNKNNEFRSYLIELALFSAISVCEDPSREYYKKSLKELLGTRKKSGELTDAEKSDLSDRHEKYIMRCHADVFSNNEYKNQNLVKIYCYELYLNRYESLEDYFAEAKFWDENGSVSNYVKDIVKKIDLDSDYNLNSAECFREINKLYDSRINK